MNCFLRSVCMTGFCVASLLAMPARATIVSGCFGDAGNAALISSDGFGDLEAPQFGSDDAVVRNVAIYALNVVTPGTLEFASRGYTAGGAQPYLSLFAGSSTPVQTATTGADAFQDASFQATAYFEAGHTISATFSTYGSAAPIVYLCVAGFYVTP